MKTKQSIEEIERLNKHRHKIYNKHYKKWKEDPVYCPYLQCKVFATKNGWEHTVGLNKARTMEDTHRRLDLFKYAREIVKDSGTCQYIRHQNGKIHYKFEAMVAFKGEFDVGKKHKRVKVIVLKREDGVCLYHSVMD